MATLTFTPNLARHVPCPTRQVEAVSLRAALDAYFALEPDVQSYVLDEQGALRKHVVIFIDGQQLRDRDGLSDALHAGASVYVMQALSGG
jgi:hypothetical protein